MQDVIGCFLAELRQENESRNKGAPSEDPRMSVLVCGGVSIVSFEQPGHNARRNLPQNVNRHTDSFTENILI